MELIIKNRTGSDFCVFGNLGSLFWIFVYFEEPVAARSNTWQPKVKFQNYFYYVLVIIIQFLLSTNNRLLVFENKCDREIKSIRFKQWRQLLVVLANTYIHPKKKKKKKKNWWIPNFKPIMALSVNKQNTEEKKGVWAERVVCFATKLTKLAL